MERRMSTETLNKAVRETHRPHHYSALVTSWNTETKREE